MSTVFRVKEELAGFYLYAILNDMHGRMVFHLKEESTDLGIKQCQPNDYQITVQIPPLWLNPGLYSFQFKVLTWGQAGWRYVSDPFPLDISGESSKVDAILHPRGEWRVEAGSLTLERELAHE